MDGGNELQLVVDLVQVTALVAEAEQLQGTVVATLVHLTQLMPGR